MGLPYLYIAICFSCETVSLYWNRCLVGRPFFADWVNYHCSLTILALGAGIDMWKNVYIPGPFPFSSHDCCIIAHAFKTHLKVKSCESPFAHNSFLRCPILLKFHEEHNSETIISWTKFWNNWATDVNVMDEGNLVRFVFKMSFCGIS